MFSKVWLVFNCYGILTRLDANMIEAIEIKPTWCSGETGANGHDVKAIMPHSEGESISYVLAHTADKANAEKVVDSIFGWVNNSTHIPHPWITIDVDRILDQTLNPQKYEE